MCVFKRFVFGEKRRMIDGGKEERKVYLIEKGMRGCFVLENGKEIRRWFWKEGDGGCG